MVVIRIVKDMFKSITFIWAAWNAVVLFLTMAMGKIGIASWPFWLKTRTRIEKRKSP